MEGYSDLYNQLSYNFLKVPSTIYGHIFSEYRHHKEIYGPLDNGDVPPNSEADEIAKKTNGVLYDQLKQTLYKRRRIGYGDSISAYSTYTNLDSRHIMLLCLIFTTVKIEDLSSIIEIGSGYGNMLFLASEYLTKKKFNSKWVCIDLPHVLLLQKWFCKQCEVPATLFEQISANSYEETVDVCKQTLVISCHGLSELSIDVFNKYMENIVKKSKYFFYVYHETIPSKELVDAKMNVVLQLFKPLNVVKTENNKVYNIMFVNRLINV